MDPVKHPRYEMTEAPVVAFGTGWFLRRLEPSERRPGYQGAALSCRSRRSYRASRGNGFHSSECVMVEKGCRWEGLEWEGWGELKDSAAEIRTSKRRLIGEDDSGP